VEEQWPSKPLVVGSNPTGCTTLKGTLYMKDADPFNSQDLLKPRIIPKTLKKLGRLSYSVHNIIGHPIAEIFWILGLEKAGDYVHDITIPYPDTKD
jgi:hypothetical protein